ELNTTPLVGREGGSGTRDTLSAALAARLGPGTPQAPPALSVSSTAAVRAAVLAGAAPAVISELAVAEDLAAGRLVAIQVPELDLRRTVHATWNGTPGPPAGPVRDLIAPILSAEPTALGHLAGQGAGGPGSAKDGGAAYRTTVAAMAGGSQA